MARDMTRRDRIILGAIYLLFRVLGALSEPSREAVAQRLGRLLFRLDRKHRRIAMDNLNRAFGTVWSQDAIRRCAQAVFVNMFRIVLEVAWAVQTPPAQMVKRFKLYGLHHLTAARRKGRGTLVLTGHFGLWELLPQAAGLFDVPVSVVYRPLDFPPLDRFFHEFRTRFGAQMVSSSGAVREVVQRLRRQENVTLLMDQNVDWYEGVFVDFFGHRACSNKSLALLAMRTGAPVVPVYLSREPGGGFRVDIAPEVPTLRSGDKQRDVEENTLAYNRVLESFIRQRPDQWFWVHQRWKTRPHCPWPRGDWHGA
ncbi:MAG: lysophospholipid acyltransferase family protein [Pseudomonadota bacterium]